jgi:anti-anti-sigma factor
VDRLALEGEVDMAVADDLLIDLLERVEGDPSPILEIDCSRLTFIDSSGLAMLVALRTKTAKRLVLYSIPDNCRQPFAITRLDAVFVLRDE